MQDYRTLANLLRALVDEDALGSLPAVDRDWIEAKLLYLAAHDPEAGNCETVEEVRKRHGDWMLEMSGR